MAMKRKRTTHLRHWGPLSDVPEDEHDSAAGEEAEAAADGDAEQDGSTRRTMPETDALSAWEKSRQVAFSPDSEHWRSIPADPWQ